MFGDFIIAHLHEEVDFSVFRVALVLRVFLVDQTQEFQEFLVSVLESLVRKREVFLISQGGQQGGGRKSDYNLDYLLRVLELVVPLRE